MPQFVDAFRRSGVLGIGVRGLFLCALLSFFGPTRALAQSQLASVAGKVKDGDSGKPMPSVTVVIQGPALQGFQSEVSDSDGNYIITQLPPGDEYVVEFYFGADDKPQITRRGIRLSTGKTLTVDATIGKSAAAVEKKVIRETAPNVDTANASAGIEVNQELLRNTPVRGRTFESILALAPGAADVTPRSFSQSGGGPERGTDVGVSISGSTGSENSIIIDGINTTDPGVGLVGTELSQYFIKEISIITAGYQAEYGRATGGLVSMVTKSGGNEFHGSVFGSVQPYQLDPPAIMRLGEAITTRTKVKTLFDAGFDLGGYLIKDRIWFYVGFAPTITNLQTQRRVRLQTYDPTTGRAQADPDFQCPSYLYNSLYCSGPRQLAARSSESEGSGQDLARQKSLYNWIAKFQFNLNPNHNITLGYIGSPVTYDDYSGTRNVDIESVKYSRVDQVHDVSARYLGKLLDHKIQIDALYGFHYQSREEMPLHADLQNIRWYASGSDPYSLDDFERLPGCERQTVMFNGASRTFNPCPLTQYERGFQAYYQKRIVQRHMLMTSATAFAALTQKWNPLRGVHAIKLGFDFEDLRNDSTRGYTGTDLDPNDPNAGHRAFLTSGDGSALQITRETFVRDASGNLILVNNFRGLTETRNYAVYLRDSWNVGWAPGLVLNLGVRWEGQELYGADLSSIPSGNLQLGPKALGIYDNWAPRIGLVWDFTRLTDRPGRGKIFFNYGRFYESIPTDINDRQFSGEGASTSGFSTTCATAPARSLDSGGQPRPVVMPGSSCNFDAAGRFPLIPGTYALVQPGLKGQFINEFVLGLSYDVGWDVVLGLSYIHRDLGRIVEDLSPDGAATYLVANPGEPPDPGQVQKLQEEINRLQQIPNPNTETQTALATAQSRLSAYQQIGYVFPRAVRNYNALIFTFSKRLSHRFSVLGSYTYSRTIGNYPGTFSASNGQLNPNISSQFDLTNLLTNRNGPLPADRPHNFKLTGFYIQPVSSNVKLTFGMTFSAYSGRPIEILGSHLYYGPSEVFVLPRGSGGRTPSITQFDLSVGYEHSLPRGFNLRLFADVINLFNQRAVTNIDEDYTFDVVDSIQNGRPEDLRHLKRSDGSLPVYNTNYGQPTAYQEPLYFRLGGRVSF